MKNQEKRLNLVLITISILIPAYSMAESQPEMSQFFTSKISGFNDQLIALEQGNSTSVFPSMTLADINVQVGTSATFGITSILSISISPEVDFMVTPVVAQ